MTYYARVIEPRECVFNDKLTLAGPAPDMVIRHQSASCAAQTDDTDATLLAWALGTDNTSNPVNIEPNSAVHIEAVVVAACNDIAGSWHLEATVRRPNDEGNAVMLGSVTVLHEQKTDVGLSCNIVASGYTASIQVTGLDSQTIEWRGVAQYTIVTNLQR